MTNYNAINCSSQAAELKIKMPHILKGITMKARPLQMSLREVDSPS
jgi:hypothetical protein